MAFYDRIQPKYMALIPALFFAALGAADITGIVVTHELTIAGFLFNAILFIPLVLRNWRVYIASGILAILLALYGLLAIFVWYIKYLDGAHFRYLFDTFVIGPLFIFSILLSGLSLLYAGVKISRRSGAGTLKNSF